MTPQQYKEQRLKEFEEIIKDTIIDGGYTLEEQEDRWLGADEAKERLEDFLLKSIDGAYEKFNDDLREKIYRIKDVIMWSDDPAQHIRNLQHHDTLEKVLSLLTPKEK